ncbi:MAG: serine/threonine-protein kinase [Gemmataceae bacterium]
MDTSPPDGTDATLDYVIPVSDMGATQELNDTGPIPLAGAPAPKPAVSAAPKTIIKLSTLGDFRLIAKLGEGGMGTVYKAEQISRKRLVALKVMNRDLASRPGYVARFHREARAMSKIDHPNLVRCLAAGESHGFIYLAMEYLEGGSLQSRIGKDGLDVGEAVRLILAVAHGLQAAHSSGLIHRDIKPDNILLSRDGIPKITDLGLAKAADEEGAGLTQTGIGIGTPLYAAPEQVKDAKNVDVRCDIYALGCVLYHCLVGKPPFVAETLLGMIKVKEKGTYIPASVAKPGLPVSLDRILTKMLAKLPEHRYDSCFDVAQELEWTGLATESTRSDLV